jgi:hypothetical protein
MNLVEEEKIITNFQCKQAKKYASLPRKQKILIKKSS